jgi:hypothetical protein
MLEGILISSSGLQATKVFSPLASATASNKADKTNH